MSERSSEDEEGDPLVEVGGEMPSSTSDLRKFLFPSNKYARFALYGSIFFVVAVILWGVFWFDSTTAGPPGIVKKQKWSPADPVFPLSVLHDMDLMQNPCQNFYSFSCHNFQTSPLPKGESAPWSRAWDTVKQMNHKVLHKQLETDKGKAGVFYRSCMNDPAIIAAGILPLHPYLQNISYINDEQSLMQMAGTLHSLNIPVFFDWEILADPFQPTRSVLRILPGGWTLPDYSYYTSSSPAIKKKREQYESVVNDILLLSGLDKDKAAAQTKNVLFVEKALAEMVLPSELESANDTVDATPRYVNLTQLQTLSPSLHLDLFFARVAPAANIGKGVDNILVDEPKMFQKLSAFISQCSRRPILDSVCSIEQTKSYLRFRLAYLLGAYLGVGFQKCGDDMQKIITGSLTESPRWESCVVATSAALPDLVGDIFVKKMFGERKKEAAVALVDELKVAVKSALRTLPWLSPQAKKEALAKLHAMQLEVGAPEKFQSYPAVTVQEAGFALNGISAQEDMVRRAFQRLSEKVDRTRWPGTTSVVSVNVFYSQELNTLYIPAGILQPPFFSPAAERPRNFGSIGAIIAQELSHAFDATGRYYDASQKLRDWWGETDVAAFDHRADCVSALYSEFFEAAGPVNPRISLRQNVADISGVSLAYKAAFEGSGVGWGKYTEGPDGGAPSLGEKQLFFVSWAQTWCSQQLPKPSSHALAVSSASDAYRAFAPLTQMPQFGKSFHCPVHSLMNPVKRCPSIL